jgi:uncharacterized protein with GYD domain
MGTFFMFGKYSFEAINKLSAQRTEDAKKLIENVGGKLVGGYALLGDVDIVLIVELPNKDQAMKLSVELAKLLGIGFTTAPAVTFEDFDKLIAA